MDEAHGGGQRLLAAQGDTAEAFELVEEALDLMAFLVEPPVDVRRDGSAGVGLDLRGGAQVIGDEGASWPSVVGGVSDDMTDAAQAGQQSLSLWAISFVRRCRLDTDRQADGVDGRVQLGRQAPRERPRARR